MSDALSSQIKDCRLCATDFAATVTAHLPRPVPWFSSRARILIAGQAPGARVHASGRPFDDASGARLRDWLGISEETFWNRDLVAFLPMAFCFPGYDARGADLPPPPRCAATWRARALASLPHVGLTFLIGGHAQRWHLGASDKRGGVTATVRRWRDHAPEIFPLPHPSWRNSGWLKQNPWFTTDLLPTARAHVKAIIESHR